MPRAIPALTGAAAPSATSGTGLAVNGLASTPYNVAVGGTQFNEGSGSYWNAGNGTGDTSAISYIPEIAWNESGAVSGGSGLWATGGGASAVYGKPSWQVSPGVPADGKRDVPDVSLSAAGHDAYLVESQGALQAIGGTSASSPSFAGLMALVVQKTGQRQGNANARFYQLGNSQYGSGERNGLSRHHHRQQQRAGRVGIFRHNRLRPGNGPRFRGCHTRSSTTGSATLR